MFYCHFNKLLTAQRKTGFATENHRSDYKTIAKTNFLIHLHLL